jgi:hypothetical protein
VQIELLRGLGCEPVMGEGDDGLFVRMVGWRLVLVHAQFGDWRRRLCGHGSGGAGSRHSTVAVRTGGRRLSNATTAPSFRSKVPGPLSTAFLRATGRGTPPGLESVLSSIVAAGRARWPGVQLSPEAFCAYAGERVSAEELLAAPASFRGADLFLACACVKGDPAALRYFEDEYLVPLGPALARVGFPDDVILDEAVAALSPRQRNVLRQQFVHRLTVAQIAHLYGVHRATAVRWLSDARVQLIATTRRALERRLALDPGDVARLADDLVSSAHVSLRSAFASSEESFAARAAHR